MGPLDAWVIRRILCVQPINGEVAGVSEAWRPLAERLARAQPGERPILFDGYLTGRRDREAIVRSVANVDPTGPAPTVEDQRAWEQGEAEPRSEAVLLRASEVTPDHVEWLWPDRVPLGMLTLFSGDPKLGKSLTTLSMIARLSRGEPPPGSSSRTPTGSTILLSAEDDVSRTVVPRLRAAGADLSKVHILPAIRDRAEPGIEAVERPPTLCRYDLEVLERTVQALGDCRLLVIDPVSAYLGDCDDQLNANLRAILAPLKDLAERLNLAVVLVTHHSKGSAGSTNGKYRVLGSIAYVGTCRANFLFLKDPDDVEGCRVLMLDNGGNLAAKQPALAYVVRDDGAGPYCDWQPETIDLDADTALAKAARAASVAKGERSGGGQTERRVSRCVEWLKRYMGSGGKPAAEAEAAGVAAGFTKAMLFRARGDLGVISRQVTEAGKRCWYWFPPMDEQSEDDAGSPPPFDEFEVDEVWLV
jgi:hypothetical protein